MSNYKVNSTGEAGWKYAKPAIYLHWVLALLIVSLVGIGWYMMSIEDDPGSDLYFNLHQSFGMVVFGLVLLRMIWRATHRPAPLPMRLPKWQVNLSRMTEWALYVCMLLMPILGFLGALYSKSGVAFFGTHLPSWTVPNLYRAVARGAGPLLPMAVDKQLLASLRIPCRPPPLL